METIQKLLELLKIKVSTYIGISVSLSILLFAPDEIIGKLGLLVWRDEGKLYFGVTILICIAIILSNAISFMNGAICAWYKNFTFLRAGKKRLHVLTAEEMQILSGYIESKSKTQYLSMDCGVVNGLVDERIIYRVTEFNSPIHGGLTFAYNILPWAWDYLNKNSYLLRHIE